MQEIANYKSFNGQVEYYQHSSEICQCEMTFSVFLPSVTQQKKCPAILWLSGLTCSHENFITKAGAQRYAEEHGIILIMPDTSPRGVEISGADENYDLGFGAGFYVDATQAPWQTNFNMYSYILDELMPLCQQQFPIQANTWSIMGHSMGGHGALILGLRNPEKFRSISAFSPICAPMQCAWGKKAFEAYLGSDKDAWCNYDSSFLLTQVSKCLPIKIDQGSADQFLNDQLKPDIFIAAAKVANYNIDYQLREGYDHSYYFISSFIDEHVAFHSEFLKEKI